jgi:flagellar FliL protein
MAENKSAPETEQAAPSAEAGGGGKKKLVLIGVLAGGIIAGVALGLFVVGPMFVGAPDAHAAATDSTSQEEEGNDGEHKEGEGATSLHVMENVVLNPAGSGGTRFLMMGAVFEAKDAAIVNELKARDAEARDVVLRVMGAKSVDELAETSNRERLKAELIDSMNVLFKKGAIRRVYFPQFVIQ